MISLEMLTDVASGWKKRLRIKNKINILNNDMQHIMT